MSKPTLEDKFDLLVDALGKPKCRYFNRNGAKCLKTEAEDLFYVNHFSYCSGDIRECDYDKEKLTAEENEELKDKENK